MCKWSVWCVCCITGRFVGGKQPARLRMNILRHIALEQVQLADFVSRYLIISLLLPALDALSGVLFRVWMWCGVVWCGGMGKEHMQYLCFSTYCTCKHD